MNTTMHESGLRDASRKLRNVANEHDTTLTLSTGGKSVTIGPDVPDAGERHEPFTPPFVAVPPDLMFEDLDREFLIADDLAALGRILLDSKSALRGIKGTSISYLWKRKGGQSGGKVILGKCAKTPPMVKTYRASTFTIWLAADHVRDHDLSQDQIEALLFHELCHAGLEEVENEKTGDVTIRPVVWAHDLEMFSAEVEEYGLWRSELRRAKDTFEQAGLPGLDVVAAGVGL